MPIPILIAGLAAAAGVIGAGGHMSASGTNEKAQKILCDAKDLYEESKCSLNQAKGQAEKALIKLGCAKKDTLDTSMKQFLDAYDKVKNIQFKESSGIQEISYFTIGEQGAMEVREMTNIYSGMLASGATGVATGAVVAMAASGSLAFVTSGIASAGSALMAGELGLATGMAGSTLSMGVAFTPFAAVAAPVLLFTGVSASIKADENLEKANASYAQASAAAEKMKISETLCNGLAKKSDMFCDLLDNLNIMFAECSGLMAAMIKKKEGIIFKKKLSSKHFTEEELKLMAVTRALAGAVKAVIDTPILSETGEITKECDQKYSQTAEKLSDFTRVVGEVKQVDYGVKPQKAPRLKKNKMRVKKEKKTISMPSKVGEIGSVVLSVIFAYILSPMIARNITTGTYKILFIDAYWVNLVAVAIFIFTASVIIMGKFKWNRFSDKCRVTNAVCMVVFYVQYCRTAEGLKNYLLVSAVVLILSIIILVLMKDRKYGSIIFEFIASISICTIAYACLFICYRFIIEILGFPNVISLIITSIVMFGIAKRALKDD